MTNSDFNILDDDDSYAADLREKALKIALDGLSPEASENTEFVVARAGVFAKFLYEGLDYTHLIKVD